MDKVQVFKFTENSEIQAQFLLIDCLINCLTARQQR